MIARKLGHSSCFPVLLCVECEIGGGAYWMLDALQIFWKHNLECLAIWIIKKWKITNKLFVCALRLFSSNFQVTLFDAVCGLNFKLSPLPKFTYLRYINESFFVTFLYSLCHYKFFSLDTSKLKRCHVNNEKKERTVPRKPEVQPKLRFFTKR